MEEYDSSTTANSGGDTIRQSSMPPPWQHSSQQYSQQSLDTECSQSSQTTQGSQSREVRRSGTGGGAWNAPIAHFMMTETSGQTYGFGLKTEEQRYCRLAEEARKWVLGPMPPQEFLDTFLKRDAEWVDLGEMPASEEAFQAVPESAKLEQSIYEPLAEAMNAGRCPGFTFCITSEAADTSGPLGLTGSCKPDLCCYADQHLRKVEDYEKPPPKPKSKPKPKPKEKKQDDEDGLGGGSGQEDDDGGSDSELEGSRTPRQTSPTAPATEPELEPAFDSTASASSLLKPVPMKRSHLGYAALVIEVKQSLGHDVFCDPKGKDNRAEFHFVTESADVKVVKRLGQQVAYAGEMCKRQHRHFCFTISVCSHYARFIRWDRAGAIVSERFSVRDQPELLCDFLWRFACASHAQRGYDLTVEPADEDQAETFESTIEAHVRRQGGPTRQPDYDLQGAVQEHYEKESVTVIHLPTSSSSTLPDRELVGHYLLVSRPIAIPLSVTGRGTRAYWAVDSLTNNVCLLKDTWRYDAPGEDASEREGDVLNDLGAITKNVPPVMYHEDVLRSIVVMDNPRPEETDPLTVQHNPGDVQTTLTQDFLEKPWVCRANHTPDQQRCFIIKRTHYRLVLGVAGYPLLRFKDSNELLHATYDALGALKAAFKHGKRLHRDITPGNIILYNDAEQIPDVTSTSSQPKPRKGYLIDWELSRRCDSELTSYIRDRNSAVSATWQFLSAAIAKHYKNPDDTPRQRHTIGDDIESMIYVVLYCALLWLPFKSPAPQAIQNVLNMLDYWTPWKDGAIRGGQLKSINLEDRSYTSSLEWTVPTIQRWLTEALRELDDGRKKPSKSKRRTLEKVFHAWWGGFLAEWQGENAERSDNTKVKALQHIFKSKTPAAVMDNIAHQSTKSAPVQPTKRLREDASVPSKGEGGPSSSKRGRVGWGDKVSGGGQVSQWSTSSWRTPENEGTDTTQGAASWDSEKSSSVFRDAEWMGIEGGIGSDRWEDPPPGGYESDPGLEGDDEGGLIDGWPSGEVQDEDEGGREMQVSDGKGKGRAQEVKGWGR